MNKTKRKMYEGEPPMTDETMPDIIYVEYSYPCLLEGTWQEDSFGGAEEYMLKAKVDNDYAPYTYHEMCMAAREQMYQEQLDELLKVNFNQAVQLTETEQSIIRLIERVKALDWIDSSELGRGVLDMCSVSDVLVAIKEELL